MDEWLKWFFGQGGNCYSVVTLLSLSSLFPFWTNAECPGEGQSEMLRRMAMDSERVRKQRVPMGRLIGEGRRDHRLMGTFLDKFHGVRGGSKCREVQGDAGGLAVDYVDLDFQVPPVCPLALPIQP